MLPSYFLSMAKKDNFNEHKFFKCFYEKKIQILKLILYCHFYAGANLARAFLKYLKI